MVAPIVIGGLLGLGGLAAGLVARPDVEEKTDVHIEKKSMVVDVNSPQHTSTFSPTSTRTFSPQSVYNPVIVYHSPSAVVSPVVSKKEEFFISPATSVSPTQSVPVDLTQPSTNVKPDTEINADSVGVIVAGAVVIGAYFLVK